MNWKKNNSSRNERCDNITKYSYTSSWNDWYVSYDNQKWYANYGFITYGWASILTIQDNKALQRLQRKIIWIINFESF